MANNVGTLVIAPVRPQSDVDTFPSAYANELYGGWHQYATLSQRNAISSDRKQDGMSCYVLETSGAYIWSGGQWNNLTANTDGKANLVGGNTFYGDQTIWGNVNISGSLNYISTQELLIEDNYVVTNSTVTGAPNLDSGLKVNRGSLTDAIIKFNESIDKWQAGNVGSEENIVLSSDLNSYTLLSTTASISGNLSQDIANLDLDLQSQIGNIRTFTSDDGVTSTTDYDPIAHSTNRGTIKYLLHLDDGTNISSSEIMATYSGSTVNFNEFAINEVGSAITGATWSVVATGGNIVMRLTVTSGTYSLVIARDKIK